jgi:hypothetical protein
MMDLDAACAIHTLLVEIGGIAKRSLHCKFEADHTRTMRQVLRFGKGLGAHI